MELNKQDPRLMDYVLGELDPEEARALESALKLPQNAEALREVEALRGVVQVAATALEKDAPAAFPEGLSPDQRNSVLARAEHPVVPFPARQIRRWGKWIAAAAAVLVLFIAGVFFNPFLMTAREAHRRTAFVTKPAEMDALERQRIAEGGGAERFLVQNIEQHEANRLANRSERSVTVTDQATIQTLPAPPPSPESLPSIAPPPSPPSPSLQNVQVGGSIRIRGSNDGDVHVRPGVQSMDDASAYTKDGWNDLPIGAMSGLGLQADNKPEVLPPDIRQQLESLGYFESKDETLESNRYKAYIVPSQSLPYYPGGERYAVIEEKPFIRADETPLSTFSLHPDTAAYSNIRRFLQQGQRPPHDAVRIEELINYFDYAYPQPVGKHPFSVNIETGPCPWAPGQLLAKIGLQGRRIDLEERPPANLVFLIDVSGSMQSSNRLPLVKESMKALVEELRPDDRVGIVTYAGNSEIALKSISVGEGRDRIPGVIERLNAGGSTHGSAGIQDAYAMAQRNFLHEGINRVILATDGDFNVGVQSREGLLALIEEKRQTGIFLTVLGYGMGNLKDGTLEMLASKGNGNYAYIDSYREARRVLIEQLSGTLMTIAKDTKIQVEFNPAQVRAYRLIGFENRMLAARDFNDDTKDAGEIGAGHTVTAIYQIVPHGVPITAGVDPLRYQETEPAPPSEPARTGEMMFVKLRYKAPDSDTSELIEIPVPARARSLDECTADYRIAAAAAGFGLLLRDSPYKGEANYDLIRQLVSRAINNDPKREEFLDLVVTAKTLAGQ